MFKQNIRLFAIIFLLSQSAFAAVNTEEAKLLEELTGKKAVKAMPAVAKKPAPLSERHLQAGLEAFKNKNYILAVKHLNTVIIKYSKSKEVKLAYAAKARLYSEMGLTAPAALNAKLALGQKQESQKTVK